MRADSGESGGERLLRVSEVAERLGVSPRTLYRLIAGGEFPEPVKVGRSSRVLVSDVAGYIEGLKRRRGA